MRRFRSVTWLLAALSLMTMPVVAMAQIISITIAPPELPVYEQPAIPAPGYIWTPGFWAYGPDGYYWVPGTWVEPPQVGLLWTPGYWSWHGGYYGWNAGYWGTQVGFYGGVDYGYGYSGIGYGGGRWTNGVFAYNRTVNNFGGVAVTNVYNQTIVNNTTNITHGSVSTAALAAQPRNPRRRSRPPRANRTSRRLPCKPSTNISRAPTERCSRPKIMAIRRLRRLPSRVNSPAKVSWRRGRLGRLPRGRRQRPRPRHFLRSALNRLQTGRLRTQRLRTRGQRRPSHMQRPMAQSRRSR